jgi:allophanate hydrolase subunit 1
MLKQLTTEELQQIRDLKQEYNNLVFTLGELQIKKTDIEEDIKTLSESRKAIYDKEKVLAKQLQEKYGEGSINLETGEVS